MDVKVIFNFIFRVDIEIVTTKIIPRCATCITLLVASIVYTGNCTVTLTCTMVGAAGCCL